MPTSSYLLALDPGLHCCGVALFRDGALVRAAALRGTKGRGPATWAQYGRLVTTWLGDVGPGTTVVEEMQVHAGGKARPADLLELAGVSGVVIGAVGWPAVGALASLWKGQCPRDIFGDRVARHLRDEGMWHCIEVPRSATELNDALHAVGLGRWWLTTHPETSPARR